MDARAQGTMREWKQECQAIVVDHQWLKLSQLTQWQWWGHLSKGEVLGIFKEQYEGDK